ncbi:MAG: hypothetical protein FD123_2685 [Bacteroidetes bacterium]|nr:MAG: hypothetical protein FD123_2685 [Bacteroidota bacterium]
MGLLRNKILIITGILLLLGGCTWLFLLFSGSKTPVGAAVNAIPVNAFCVIKTEQARQTWKKLAQGNILWEDLGATQTIASVSRTGRLLDSLLEKSPDAANLFEKNPAWLSLHCTGNDQLNWFFAVSLRSAGDENDVHEFIRNAGGGKKAQEEKHTGDIIYKTGSFSYAVREGILLLSDNAALVGASLDQLTKGQSLMKNKRFADVLNTAGAKADGNIYISYDRLPLFIKRMTAESFHDNSEALSHFAAWTEVDLTIKPNAAMLNGFTTAVDTSGDFLAIFRKQEPQRIDMISILPQQTSTMVCYGISDFAAYYKAYETYLEKNGLGAERSSTILGMNSQYRIDAEELMTSWAGNELALVTTAGPGTLEDNTFAVISASDITLAREKLGRMKYITDFIDRQAASHEDMLPDTSFFNGYSIRRIGILHLVPAIYGSLFERLNNTYYAIVGNYVVFANSPESLRSFIVSQQLGKTLANDRFYMDFVSNLSGESNVYVYSALRKSKNVYKQFTSGAVSANIEDHAELLGKLEGVGIQFSARNGMFYSNAYLRHSNPEVKQEANSLWEIALDTTFSFRPQLVMNHNTKALDIFVQDDANTIYLVSNTGKTWWKRQLPEKIMSDVQQVDALKNGKLQLVFNTSSSIYVIDRNGKDLERFPLKLPAPASGPLRVFDYENNRDYRMLISCTDKRTYNYTIKGEKVEGWKFETTGEIVVAPIRHAVIGAKDYIVLADRSGRIYAVDRQGRTRLQLKQRLPAPVDYFVLEPGKDLERTRITGIDSAGNVTRIKMNDVPENFQLAEFVTKPAFEYADINADGVREYIMLDSVRLSVFSQDKKPLFNFVSENGLSKNIRVFILPGNDMRIGLVSPVSAEIHLLNGSGAESTGFPLIGNTPFSIGNLNNDGNYVLVCGGNRNHLYAYPVK